MLLTIPCLPNVFNHGQVKPRDCRNCLVITKLAPVVLCQDYPDSAEVRTDPTVSNVLLSKGIHHSFLVTADFW